MALHVAPMSHGVADTVRQPLKILGNILQHINRKWRTQSAAKSKIPSYFQSGGGGRTRTYEGIASGFTVRPLCRSGHSPAAAGGRGGFSSTDTCGALFKLLGDVIELGIERAADRIHGSNDHDRNAGGDQTVFDGGSARLIIQKGDDLTHLTQLLWSIRQYRTATPLRRT